MIEVESAIELMLCHFIKTKKEKIPLECLNGRILAEPIRAQREQPPFDRVAMDGIAVHGNGSLSDSYKIEGMQKAGYPPKKLQNLDHAIEVMTGAMLPQGTNTVIPYEDVSIHHKIAMLKKGYRLKERKNIHVQGSDYLQGTILLYPGTKLTSTSVALIAGQGFQDAMVFQYPKIAVISTGDELIRPGEKCEKWQIWRSNSYGIYAELASLGHAKANVDIFCVGDDQNEMLTLFSNLLGSYQMLILSGGVSMGKYDFVHSVMNDLGVKKIFHKVKQKPGKPIYFGIGPNKENIFGLPGNPVSALICMRRYVIFGLEAVLGCPATKLHAVLGQEVEFEKDFTLFKAVNVRSDENGRLMAHPISSNGSGDFWGLARSDGFLQLPSNKKIYKKGEIYPFFSWIKA